MHDPRLLRGSQVLARPATDAGFLLQDMGVDGTGSLEKSNIKSTKIWIEFESGRWGVWAIATSEATNIKCPSVWPLRSWLCGPPAPVVLGDWSYMPALCAFGDGGAVEDLAKSCVATEVGCAVLQHQLCWEIGRACPPFVPLVMAAPSRGLRATRATTTRTSSRVTCAAAHHKHVVLHAI